MADEQRMNFYRTFYDLTTLLPERERQRVNTALLDYFFEGVEPTGLSESGMKVFRGCEGRISKSRTNASNVSARYSASKHTKQPTNDPTKRDTEDETKSRCGEPTKRHPEREREGEIESEEEDEPKIPYAEIVAALNEAAGTSYRPTSRKTREFIRARWAEGYRLGDFEKVIGTMAREWCDDPRMCAYLRPETLFGTKFEGYLNHRGARKEDGYGAYD